MLKPCGDPGVAECLMPMLLTQAIENLDNLPEKITPDIWLANTVSEYARHLRDYPIDILRAACDAHVRGGSQFFPKVFEITKHATPALEKRQRESWRVDKLIECAKTPTKAAAAAFKKDPPHSRLLTILKWQEMPGSNLYSVDKAAKTRRELAKLAEDERVKAVEEGRPVEEWATFDYTAGLPPAPPEPEPLEASAKVGTFKSVGAAAAKAVEESRELSPESQAALKRSLARKHRAAGRTDYADRLDREADALDPRGPDVVTDIPEREHA